MAVYDSLPWRRINDYLVSVGSAKSLDELYRRSVAEIGSIIGVDAGSSIRLVRPGEPLCVAGTRGADWSREFNEYYRHRFPIPWSFVESERVTDFTPWEGTEYVTDFVRPKRLWSCMTVLGSGTMLALYRERHAPEFADWEVAALQVVGAHLENYRSLLCKIASLEAQVKTAADIALDTRDLTRREAEIVKLLALKLTTREIASLLLISPRTVERHIANVYDKFDVHNRYALLHRLYGPEATRLSRATQHTGRSL